jgi:plastocyanin
VVIPQGIQDPNASQLQITFQPVHITVVLGVNNTIVFENHDNVEHIIQSTAWPSDSSPFQFWSLPGKTNTVTLNETGDYNYTCVWHPLWMQGSITVVART